MSQQKPASFALGKPGTKNDDDVVIVSACRTAITKARKGAFANTHVEDLLAAVFKEAISRAKVDPKVIGDIVVGSVLGSNVQRANEARIAQFFAGIPDTVAVHTINRQCSSGIQAVAHVAASIKAGYYDVGLAAGVESMSTAKMGWEGNMNPQIFMNQQAKETLLPMGITSENVSQQWKITRREQDELAARSNQLAIEAIKKGNFKNEIVPVKATIIDPKTHQKTVKIVDTDEGPRDGVTADSLGKLKPAFDPKGSTTAGNASQVSDGAAAVLLMTRAKAKELGCPIIGVFRAFSVVGVPPAVMGIGPAYAIPAALKQCALEKSDIDVYEINEAFASQACMSINHLGLPMEKVNPNGGAIALGHPLGATGARQVSTLLNELTRRRDASTDKNSSENKPWLGCISMCIGSGMGACAVLELD
jgi:acetyl-CoA acyltransferase 1